MPKPDILQLLVDSALQPELRRRLAEAPDAVFEEYEIGAEGRELLRQPDHRLLPLLGAALTRSDGREAIYVPVDPGPGNCLSVEGAARAAGAEVPTDSRLLPDAQMALTVVPCLVGDRIAFAAWIAPLHAGADPSRLPPPPGATLPGQPLTPLHAVIQLAAAQSKDAAGNLQVSMWASFRQSSNAGAPPPPETAGNPAASPFASPLDSPQVQAAAAAVHAAPPADRYEKLLILTRALSGGDVR